MPGLTQWRMKKSEAASMAESISHLTRPPGNQSEEMSPTTSFKILCIQEIEFVKNKRPI
jgi:hypothetical protein